jgi:hypothetical protein
LVFSGSKEKSIKVWNKNTRDLFMNLTGHVGGITTAHMYTTVIYIIFEPDISFLIILKIFEFSGLQTKMVFKQNFQHLKN